MAEETSMGNILGVEREVLGLYRENAEKYSLPERMSQACATFWSVYRDGDCVVEGGDEILFPMGSTVKTIVLEQVGILVQQNGFSPDDPIIPVHADLILTEHGGGDRQIVDMLQHGGMISFRDLAYLCQRKSSEYGFRDGRQFFMNQFGENGFDELQSRIHAQIELQQGIDHASIELLRTSADHGMLLYGGNTVDLDELTRWYKDFFARAFSADPHEIFNRVLMEAMWNNTFWEIGLYPMLQKSRNFPRGASTVDKVGIIPPTWDNKRLAEAGLPPHRGYLVIGGVLHQGRIYTVCFSQLFPIFLPGTRENKGRGMLNAKDPVFVNYQKWVAGKFFPFLFKRAFVSHLGTIDFLE